jgi:hypothetical protein
MLVFLHLLKRDPDSLPQVALRKPKFLAALPNPDAQRDIKRMGRVVI